MQSSKLSSLLAALLVVSTVGATAQIVQNGDFSANGADFTNYPGYTSNGTSSNVAIENWSSDTPTRTGVNLYTSNNSAGSVQNYFGPAGIAMGSSPVFYYAFIQNTASLTQSGLSLVAGQTYQLSFEYGQRFNFGGLLNPTTTAPAMGSITFNNGGLSFATVPLVGGVAGLDFTNETVDFVVPMTVVGTSNIVLAQNDVSGTDLTLDFTNISIVPIATLPTVPEPPNWALLGLGALLLVAYGRRGHRA